MVTLNEEGNGYCGIWYANQPLDSPYVYKYSGGLGTYCAKHSPFGIYAEEVNKTFFCFGGASADFHTRDIATPDDSGDVPDALLHMVGCYDHDLGVVARPTVVLDKRTSDAHDNPVISMDNQGYIWLFSTSHGTSRPSYIHRSVEPYAVDAFELIEATRKTDSFSVPFDNFSYMQVRHLDGKGFAAFVTRYHEPVIRTAGYMTSPDGRLWSQWKPLAAIHEGHYQIGEITSDRSGTAFNYHPNRENSDERGLNSRTNLYYLQTVDSGSTWQNIQGRTVDIPLTDPDNPAMVRDYQTEGLLVYMKDLQFDTAGRPVILYITSDGYEPGPEHEPRTWRTARWEGNEWIFNDITTSDSNYDMGSLYIRDDGSWEVIAPTDRGPEPYNPGGEMVLWKTEDQGESWEKLKTLTSDSPRNHTYARRPINYHPDFCALWADGDPREPSVSHLYFAGQDGSVYNLPPDMSVDWESPRQVDNLSNNGR
ncbi:MAG: BNR-4 repeat-containing protein [Planctomycetota bacterium]